MPASRGGKPFHSASEDPVKNGVSFDEVGKPRKQRCVPPLNLDTVPLYLFQGVSRRPPCVYLARKLTTAAPSQSETLKGLAKALGVSVTELLS